MLSRKDVENIFDRVEGGEEWEFWRDSGNINNWRCRDGTWLLQVSHTHNRIAIGDVGADGDGFETAAVEYSEDRLAILLLTLAAKDVEKAYYYLREETPSTVIYGGWFFKS